MSDISDNDNSPLSDIAGAAREPVSFDAALGQMIQNYLIGNGDKANGSEIVQVLLNNAAYLASLPKDDISAEIVQYFIHQMAHHRYQALGAEAAEEEILNANKPH